MDKFKAIKVTSAEPLRKKNPRTSLEKYEVLKKRNSNLELLKKAFDLDISL